MALTARGRLSALLIVGVLAVTGTACSDDEKSPGGGGDDAPTPEEVLEQAKTTLDETDGVTISLKTDEVPSGVTGIKSATGVGAHPAAFEGEFELSVNGLPATAEVIAVDGVTYAKNSLLLPDWTEIDPADYGAPDPGLMMEPDDGFSGLLAAMTDVEEGDSVRGGQDNREIFTEYTGTIPSSAVEALIPTAEGDFEAALTVSDAGQLRTAELTGVFYADAEALTYTLTLDDYGTDVDITAP
jgi:lipoprotein LprG